MKQRMEMRLSAIVLSAVLLFLAPAMVLMSQGTAEAESTGEYSFWEEEDLTATPPNGDTWTFTSNGHVTVSTYGSTNLNLIGNIEAIGQSTGRVVALSWENSTGSVSGDLYAESVGKATALHVQYPGSDLNYVGNITAKGNDAYGVAVITDGNTLSTTGSVVVSGDTAYGFHVDDASDVTHNGDIAAFGDNATAVYLANKATMTIIGNLLASEDLGSLSPSGEQIALDVHSGSAATVTGDATARGIKATGVHVDGNNSTLDMAGNVLAEGSSAIGVHASNNGNVTITGDVLAIGDNSVGVNASNASNVTITGGVTVTGDQATAVKSTLNSIVTINDGVIKATGTDSTLIELLSGTVNLNSVTAIADSDSSLLTGAGILTATTSTLSGHINNITFGPASFVMTLDGNSTFTGSINDDAAVLAETKLTIADAGSAWYITEDSSIRGVLENYGTVSFANAAQSTTLTVADLDSSGSTDIGSFVMRAYNNVDQGADQLVVTGTMNNSQYNLTVLNNASAATNGSEVTSLIDAADTTGIFELTNNVELGGLVYGLRQTGTLWELYSLDQMSTTWDGAANTFVANYLLAYADTQTLIQRLGDLRETPHLSGFWFKGHGGKFEVDGGSYTNAFDMDYWGVQLGYDRKLETSWDGDLYAGVMFGYSDGDLDYIYGGSGSVESKTLGVYGTFVQPNGFFVDLVLKYQWMDNDFDVTDTAGSRVHGSDASNNGFGASLEVGKRIRFAQQEQQGNWYVEPQAQLSWQNFGGGYFNTSNGMRVGTESYKSLLGRVGILIGYETGKTNFYAKVSHVKEFDGDLTIIANSSSFKGESMDDSWWSYGLGFTSKIDERNSVYIDIERASGGFFEQKWAVQAGWRVQF